MAERIYMVNWKDANGKEVLSHDDLHKDCTDIVYMIEYSDGTKYIGKKTVRSMSTLPVLKTKMREGSKFIGRNIYRDEQNNIIVGKDSVRQAKARGIKAKREYYEKVLVDKPFLKYEGSSKETEGLEITHKHIMFQSSTKKTATYIEAKALFRVDALFNDYYRNLNILGTMFDNSLDGLLEI